MLVSSDDPFARLDLDRALGDDDDSRELVAQLRPFVAELALRRPSEWQITTRRPEFSYGPDEADRHSWLATDLEWAPQQPDSVAINVEFRSWVPPRLRVDSVRLWRLRLSLEVPCACARDHGNHGVDERRFEGSSPDGLRSACSEALAQLDGWLSRGTMADPWRASAGLPSD